MFFPKIHWGLNFYGVSWFGFQIGYFTDWREPCAADHEPLVTDAEV